MSTIGNEIRSRFTFEENKIPKVSYVVVNESSEEKQVLMNVDSEEGFGFVPFHLTSDFDFSVGAHRLWSQKHPLSDRDRQNRQIKF